MTVSQEVSAGEAILRSLKQNGVDYLFISSSDFAPVIEHWQGATGGIPDVVACAHENLWSAWRTVTTWQQEKCSRGRTRQRGTRQRGDGFAQCTLGQCPDFMLSGRNPTEGDHVGSRHTPIQYGWRCLIRPRSCAKPSNGITNCAMRTTPLTS